ncbi:MAG: SGNH/GDSL hydrolase family protein [Victivallales bacterium]|nr:SGNH/GDSL hydrolase family protein [Victivallales bacterium]
MERHKDSDVNVEGKPLSTAPKREADLARIRGHFAAMEAPWTWVFYGDSITHGAVHTNGWRSFVEIFQERVRTEMARPMECVINSGDDGHTLFWLINEKTYDWQVRRHHPNVVLVLLGRNDIIRDESGGPEKFRERLTELTRRIRQDGAIPVLQTYNTMQLVEKPTLEYHKGYIRRYHEFPVYNGIIRDVAATEDTILVDHRRFWEENASDPQVLDRWLEEPLHPGPYGHLQMAILILKELGLYSPDSRCCAVKAGERQEGKD